MKKAIIKRKYYALKIELASPLKVSNGEKYHTDSDVIKNGKGEVFIPGTSLAGAFRHRLGYDSKTPGTMGYSDGEEGRMSQISISDLYLRNAVISERDGIKLDDNHMVEKGGKFDMEIIETGATGEIYFDYVLRVGDDEKQMDDDINTVLQEIQTGSIRFGSNKNRGFGKIKILEIASRTFTANDKVTEWVDFCDKPDYGTFDQFDNWLKNQDTIDSDYLHITVPLKLKGGISIRKYSTTPDKADFQHITCNGNPVVPGSSWNGAIRSDVLEILRNVSHINMGISMEPLSLIDQWFGVVDLENNLAHQSQIVVGESIIEGAQKQVMTRNKINRFDAGTKKGALYTEEAYFGGTTKLNLMVKKDENGEYKAITAMLLLAISDIQKGYVPVGGQVAVGRGIFEEDGAITFSEDVDVKCFNQCLFNLLIAE